MSDVFDFPRGLWTIPLEDWDSIILSPQCAVVSDSFQARPTDPEMMFGAMEFYKRFVYRPRDNAGMCRDLALREHIAHVQTCSCACAFDRDIPQDVGSEDDDGERSIIRYLW